MYQYVPSAICKVQFKAFSTLISQDKSLCWCHRAQENEGDVVSALKELWCPAPHQPLTPRSDATTSVKPSLISFSQMLSPVTSRHRRLSCLEF